MTVWCGALGLSSLACFAHDVFLPRFASSIIFNMTASMLLSHLPDAEESSTRKHKKSHASANKFRFSVMFVRK